MDTELVGGSEGRAEGSETRAKESNDDQEEAEMKKLMEIVPDEEEIVVDAIPLATKPPIISIDKEDLETLWKQVKAKHGLIRPEEAYDDVRGSKSDV
ncbi:hypothetical protein Tco_0150043 [Tanacetum coccineum]